MKNVLHLHALQECSLRVKNKPVYVSVPGLSKNLQTSIQFSIWKFQLAADLAQIIAVPT